MNSYYNNTPYKLNLKLKNINKNLSQNIDINGLYNNFNDSTPLIISQFCSLKNRVNVLNKTLNKIPMISHIIDSGRSYNNNYSRNLLTSPIKSTKTNYYKIPYKSPKPVLKPLNKINNNYTSYQNMTKHKNKINHKNGNFTKNSHLFSNSNSYFNYDLINPLIKSHYRRNKINIDSMNDDGNKKNNKNKYNRSNKTNSLWFTFKNNNSVNNSNNRDIYEQKFKKLNQEINEKNKIIDKMKGIIDDTYDKLNKKNKENSMLQSEIIELKSRYNESNYDNFKNNNIQENSRYNTYNNYNNNYINEKPYKYPNKRKNNLNIIKNINNCRRGNYNIYNLNEPDKVKVDESWKEIRKINKKMDNLLNKNEKNIKKYERMRKKYNSKKE
jgi:uncharacterized coiled-coil protein SlyX